MMTQQGLAFVALVVASAACNYDSPELGMVAFAADETCGDLSCALALGTQTDISVSLDGLVSDAVVSPPELATVSVSDDYWVHVRPTAAGSGTLTVFGDGQPVIVQRIAVAPLAATNVVPARVRFAAGLLYPDGTTQLYVGNTLRVVASHLDPDGAPLLGHGVEAWTITGGSFRTASSPPDPQWSEPEDLPRDPDLFRDVIADGGPEITVSAGPGSVPLQLGVVPPGSAATIDLDTHGVDGVIRIGRGQELRPLVLAFDAQHRNISGIPAGGRVELHVADENILTADSLANRRRVYLRGRNDGTTELTVRFDGLEARFTVRVGI